MPEAQDAQLEIKKRARRRLVGAIALSLFAAIVFPLVMDNDPGPMVQDIEIKIPGQDDRTLNNRLALQPPPDDAPSTASATTSPNTSPATPASEPVASPAPNPADKPQVAAVSPEPTPVIPVSPAKEINKENKPEKSADSGKESGSRAQDILNGKMANAADKPASDKQTSDKHASSGTFIILIGAYANEGNVKVLRNKMSELGVKSYTEPFGDKTRLRAGPFPNREAAEKALQKLKGIGVSGQIASK